MSLLRIAKQVALALGLPLVLVLTWWYASADSTSFFFPPLEEIIETFPATWLDGRLSSDVVPSLLRLLAGYLLAVVVGVTLGALAGSSRLVRSFIEPPLSFVRSIPPTVLVPVIILFAGVDDAMKVAVVFSGCVWPILLNAIEGVRSVDPVLRDTAAVFGLDRLTRIRKLILRGASPQIAAGCQQSLAIGIILMVISEMFAATNGVGFTIIQFQRSFAIPEMWTGILVLGTAGVVLSIAFRLIERRGLAWYYGQREQQRKG